MRKDRNYRKTLQYKIKMWFLRLTFRDVRYGIKISFLTVFEFVTAIVGFVALFIFPALFH